MSTVGQAIPRKKYLFESKQKLFLTHKMASYNMKQENIDNVSRNKPNRGKLTYEKSRKSGKRTKIAKKSHNPDITIQFLISLNVRNTLMWFN